MQINLLDHVLCDRLGTQEFKVVEQDSKHFVLEDLKTKERTKMYQALCRVTHAIHFANRARRQVRAQAIGRKPG